VHISTMGPHVCELLSVCSGVNLGMSYSEGFLPRVKLKVN
jgi:hypothetical protein